MKTKTSTRKQPPTVFGYEIGYAVSITLIVVASVAAVLLINFYAISYGPFRKYLNSDSYYQELQFNAGAFFLIVVSYLVMVAAIIAVAVHRRRSNAGVLDWPEAVLRATCWLGGTQLAVLFAVGFFFPVFHAPYGNPLPENAIFVASGQEAENAVLNMNSKYPAPVFIVDKDVGVLRPHILHYEYYNSDSIPDATHLSNNGELP